MTGVQTCALPISSPDAKSAARTRSRASETALSASPTTWKPGKPAAIWTWTSTGRASIPSNATVVVYMPGDLGFIQERLLASGTAPETPCAIISRATIEFEQVHLTTVQLLTDSPSLAAPRLLVVGEVVRLADAARLSAKFSSLELNDSSAVNPNSAESAK